VKRAWRKALEPYYTIGDIGFSGKVFAVYRSWAGCVIVSAPCVVNEKPKNPSRMKSGGWTFGVLGVNVWSSPVLLWRLAGAEARYAAGALSKYVCQYVLTA